MKTTELPEILRRFSIQPTQNRLTMLHIFMEAHGPLDIQTIQDRVSAYKGGMDRATVFRTLNTFAGHGLLHKLEFNEGKSRYELALNSHHHHLICTSCGNIACISECNLDEVTKNIEKETGFTPTMHRLEFFGVCKKCNLA